MKPLNHCLDRSGFPFHFGFHRPIRKVSDPAAQVEAQRLLFGVITEENALNPSFYSHRNSFVWHGVSSGIGQRAGLIS
jgi:hypothetical protein